MKIFMLGTAAWLLTAVAAMAQEPHRSLLNRGDAHFVVGWQNLHKDQQPQQTYDNWLNAIFYGGAGAGWFWTDHLKAQVDFGAGTEGRQYRYEPVVVNGQITAVSSRVTVRQQSLAVSQQYQFFRNQWFHPHVSGGVEIAREMATEHYDPVIVFDNVTRTSRLSTPARTEGPNATWIARPFGEVGFKAYMSRRAFFTADSRLMFRNKVDEVLFRLGFGVDF